MPILRFPDYLQELTARMSRGDRPAFVEAGMILGKLFRQFFLSYGFFDEVAEKLAEKAIFAVSAQAFGRTFGPSVETWINEMLHRIAKGELTELQNRSQRQHSARDLQSRIFRLPTTENGVKIHASYRAAQIVTGDFHDAFSWGNGKTLVVLGDVAGKGADSALYGALILGMVRAFASATDSLLELLHSVNALLLDADLQPKYSTLLLTSVCPSSLKISLATGAAGNQFLASKGKVSQVLLSGHAVGMTHPAEFGTQTLVLAEGDILILSTDGVTDQFDTSNTEQYGEARVQAVIEDSICEPSSIPNRLLADVASFQGSAATTDDQTVVAIEFCQSVTRAATTGV